MALELRRIRELRECLELIDTDFFLHLGPGHGTLHDPNGEEVAGIEGDEHELWVRLHTMDALDRIDKALGRERPSR